MVNKLTGYFWLVLAIIYTLCFRAEIPAWSCIIIANIYFRGDK